MRISMLATAIAGAVWAVTIAVATADAATLPVARAGPWIPTNATNVRSATADQGVTTVTDAGRAVTVTRGSGSVVPELAAQGWTHIGDPGSLGGSVLDAYQTSRPIGAKLFTLTTATGVRTDYVHQLVPGEMSNNSFAAVAPGGRWFVSGEWQTMTRLLVFAAPHPSARTPAVEQPLPLATTITLTRAVRNVQGCAFASSTRLVCSTNDPGTDLYPVPRQLLSVQLARPLDGRPVTGTPRLLGEAPSQTLCAGPAGEVEGIDIHGNRLIVAVNSACGPDTQLFFYTARAQGSPPPSACSPRSQPAHGADTARRETMKSTTTQGDSS
jgi:hypothetical protein